MKHICIAQKDDIEGINKIRKEIRDDKNDPHKIKDYKVDEILEEDYQTTIIHKYQNNITGFLNIHRHCSKDSKIIGIIELFVSKNYRRKGIGEALVRYIIQYCKDTKKYNEITLSVLHGNDAKRLYEKCNFIISKEDSDGLWMLLKI